MNKFEYVTGSNQEDFNLPTRSTKNSCGYDFHSPIDIIIQPNSFVKFSLGVKCQIKDGEFLMILPRSSLGFKGNNFVTMTNTAGVIDSDYYNNSSNEGCICVKLYNNSDEPFVIKKNDKIVQGIFLKYDTVDDEKEIETVRNGGFGSTGN